MASRWLGKKHAYQVKKNPLHYTDRIELCRQCIRCERHLHYMAYRLATGTEVGICKECRDELAGLMPPR